MDNIDKRIEECLENLKKEIRDVNLPKNKEFRIAKNKDGMFRLHLLKLYHIAFEQGAYIKSIK